VTVEKVGCSEKSRQSGDRKCLGEWKIVRPGQKWQVEFWNAPFQDSSNAASNPGIGTVISEVAPKSSKNKTCPPSAGSSFEKKWLRIAKIHAHHSPTIACGFTRKQSAEDTRTPAFPVHAAVCAGLRFAG
jgi:hypothetical protein